MIFILFLMTALFGGSGPPLMKFSVNNFSPIILVLLRGVLASIIILPFVYRNLTINKEKRTLLFAGILFAANWILFAVGISMTTIIMAQIIYVPTSLLVAVIGYIFIKERITKNQFYGLVLTIIGLTVLILGSANSHVINSFGTLKGNLIIVAGLFSWASYTVVSKKLSYIYSPQVITFYNFLIAALIAVVATPVLYFINNSFLYYTITLQSISGIVGLVAIASILFFMLYQYLIKNTSAFLASLVIYLVAIFGSLFGIIFFDERITINYVIGSSLIIIGVLFATEMRNAKKYLKK